MTTEDYAVLMRCIRGRRSIRRFTSQPVERELTDRIIEAAAWAPSAGNRQDWLFSIVESVDVKRRMSDAVRQRWQEIIEANREIGGIGEIERYSAGFADFESAPVVIVVSAGKPNAIQERLLGETAPTVSGDAASSALAVQNLMLAAQALGLGTCCMTGALVAAEAMKQILDLGPRREIVCLVTLGHPDESPPTPERKPMSSIVRYCQT